MCLECIYPAQFVLRLGAGVHEGLGDDVQRCVHRLRHVHLKDEVGVPQNVHPEAQGQAGGGERWDRGADRRSDRTTGREHKGQDRH